MRYFLLLFTALAIVGCVTETRVAGTNKQVVEQQSDPVEAARTRVALGLRYLQNGDPAQAKYNLTKAKQHAPQLPEVHSALAYYYQRVDEPELAEKAYQDALRYGANDGSVMNNYGVFLCQQDQYTKAIKQFMAAVQEPTYIRVADAYENAGLCALSHSQPQHAHDYFDKVLSYDAARPRTLLGLSDAYLQLGLTDSADFYFQRYLARHSLSADSAVLGYRLAVKQNNRQDIQKYRLILQSRYPQAYAALNRASAAPSGTSVQATVAQTTDAQTMSAQANSAQSPSLSTNSANSANNDAPTSVTDIVYKIQVAASVERLSAAYLSGRLKDQSLDIVEVEDDGWFKYLAGSYASVEAAEKAKKLVKPKQAFIVGLTNGQIVYTKY
ncbi:type IV pilus biogenesis/stability protein PilW [Neiella sp. HB171785]|uniref:Type IV pilus biogenesis/stability protein PilW n=1 Tax=Neiella litorisoli TaxID=2771431 RepID=A0A8J6QV29_9GAMM|nr:type IV pilus biogenesis/stability protein PilW [Neiella litorisoli]MBD1390802.1 type IV pilus biogenesis/stability protein PilW [Neiella litorisoli]